MQIKNDNDSLDDKGLLKGDRKKDNPEDSDQGSHETQKDDNDFTKKIIILPDNKLKFIFDVFILLLVAYSCIQSILNMTFSIEQTPNMFIVFYVVESCFYIDFILNFIQGFKDEE